MRMLEIFQCCEEVYWLSAWWALRLPWWPPAECSNVSMSCEYWYLQNVFLFLYHCCILSEIKLTTTTTTTEYLFNSFMVLQIFPIYPTKFSTIDIWAEVLMQNRFWKGWKWDNWFSIFLSSTLIYWCRKPDRRWSKYWSGHISQRIFVFTIQVLKIKQIRLVIVKQ